VDRVELEIQTKAEHKAAIPYLAQLLPQVEALALSKTALAAVVVVRVVELQITRLAQLQEVEQLTKVLQVVLQFCQITAVAVAVARAPLDRLRLRT
jgi:hypothetical protein